MLINYSIALKLIFVPAGIHCGPGASQGRRALEIIAERGTRKSEAEQFDIAW
jgi:hypothetical protein